MDDLTTDELSQAVKDLGDLVDQHLPTNRPVAILLNLAIGLAAKELLTRAVGSEMAEKLWRERDAH